MNSYKVLLKSLKIKFFILTFIESKIKSHHNFHLFPSFSRGTDFFIKIREIKIQLKTN